MEKGLHLKKHTQKSQLLVGSETSYLLQAADVRLDSVLLVEVDLLLNTCFFKNACPSGYNTRFESSGEFVSFHLLKSFPQDASKGDFFHKKIQCCTTPKTYLDKKKEGKYGKKSIPKGWDKLKKNDKKRGKF